MTEASDCSVNSSECIKYLRLSEKLSIKKIMEYLIA